VSAAIYRAAVIGCGQIGLKWEQPEAPQPKPATHAGAFARHPRVELVAVADLKPEALALARSLFPGVATFTDYREMLGAVRPDIVAVATPEEAHPEAVEACARLGVRAIVCEKPIARAVEDARRMIDVCARAGALLFVNHSRRFDSTVRGVRDELAAGAIGQVVQATCYYTNGLFNTGAHLVDLLRFLLGDVRWVLGAPNDRGAVPRGDVAVDALVEFASGARAALQCLDVRDYSVFDVHLYGRGGALALTRFGYEVERTRLTPRADVAGLLELDLDGRTREGCARSFMESMAAHVVDCLDGRDRPVSRGEDGLAALETLHALRESASRGGVRMFMQHTGGAHARE
jgi:predicted dehydrogenase